MKINLNLFEKHNYTFTYDNNNYKLIFEKYIGNGSTANTLLYNMYMADKDNIYMYIDNIVMKKFTCKSDYKCEKNNILKLKEKIKDNVDTLFYKKHIPLYYDNNNIVLLYYYLGSNLTYLKLKTLTLKKKLLIIKQIIEEIIFLLDNNIIHNDIKPENIVCSISYESDIIASIIDFGILYEYPDDFLKLDYINTTIWSGSPEYLELAYVINDMINEKEIIKYTNSDIKDMFFKCQHNALAGIMIGILTNNIFIYFNMVLNIVNTNEEHDMIKRFELFNLDNMTIIQNNVTEILDISHISVKDTIYNKHIYNSIVEIIHNMLEYKYQDKKPLNDIYVEIQELYNNCVK